MGSERNASSLFEVQATLYDLITAPEGVAKRLSELSRLPVDLESIVKPTAGLSAVERVDIYANMYFYRIRDVLREEFPKTVTVMGDDAFHNLVTDYLVACRPAHPSLREAGARLPDFLARHPSIEGRAWVAELARLERAHLELYDGPDAEVLTLDELRALPPDDLPGLVLQAIPSHAVLRNRFAISEAWKALAPGESAGAASNDAETLLVWRQDIEVFHRVVDAVEGPVLALIRDGARFEAVCERLLEAVPEDQAAIRAFEILGRWVADGLIAAHPSGQAWGRRRSR